MELPVRRARDRSRSAPRLQSRSLAAGDPSGDEAFGDVSAGQIQVTEAAAELPGRVEPRDWLAGDVDDLLLRIVNRPALGVRDRRPDLSEDIRRLLDLHHGAGGTAVILVDAAVTQLVPAL